MRCLLQLLILQLGDVVKNCISLDWANRCLGQTVQKLQFFCAVLLLIAGFKADPLRAEDTSSIGITEPSIATSLQQYGDPFGYRKRLYDQGISYNLIYTNDVLGNLSGGLKRGAIDQGKFETQLYIDLGKFAGWKNWTFYANGFGIYDTGRIRRDYVGGRNTIAAIEATPTIRLSELWLERQFGPASVKLASSRLTPSFSTAT